MNEIFEIAYAAATRRLCLFTGTGFSKAISANQAPGWQELLEQVCDSLPNGEELRASLFPEDKPPALRLEEAAQVIAIKLAAKSISLHEVIADIIEGLSVDGEIDEIRAFFSEQAFRIITTNYDGLAQELVGDNSCQSVIPGLPIPRSQANVKIYHVHGSTAVPETMVVTADDYFGFINKDSYFSRKLSTVLHENTVVILGYSLADTNLRAIISDYQGFSRSHLIGSNIFLISRSVVDQHVKDYYAHCYGIRVVDNMQIKDLFAKLNHQIPKVKSITDKSLESIRRVVYSGRRFKDAYLKLDDAFYRIISALSAEGLSLKDERVVNMVGEVIETKTRLTGDNGAWDQYEHLAAWLVYLGSIFEVKGSSIEQGYLSAVHHSMARMRKDYYFGYSWHAYKVWQKRWPSVMATNRTLIRDYIEQHLDWPDALAVVNSID